MVPSIEQCQVVSYLLKLSRSKISVYAFTTGFLGLLESPPLNLSALPDISKNFSSLAYKGF